RVDNDISAEVDRAAEIGCREGVVDDKRNSVFMCDAGDRFDVEDIQLRIADRLGEHRTCLGCDGAAQVFGVLQIDEVYVHAHFGQRMPEEVERAAVQAGGRDDLVAGTCDVE